MDLWETIIETTDQNQEETLTEGVLEDEILEAVAKEEKCIKLFAAIVERTVKCLLRQLAVNPFIASNVLKKTVVEPIQEGFKIEAQEGRILK